MKKTIVATAILLLFGGCVQLQNIWPQSDERILLDTRTTFNATVNTLATFRKAGSFTKEDADEITQWIYLGAELLDECQAGLELGQNTSEIMLRYDVIIRKLLAKRIAAERKESDGR